MKSRSGQAFHYVVGLAGSLAFAVMSIELFPNLFFSFAWIETLGLELEAAAFTNRKFPRAVLP
jgi:hypothetical protein